MEKSLKTPTDLSIKNNQIDFCVRIYFLQYYLFQAI